MGETLVPVIETEGKDIHFLRMKLVVRAFAHPGAPPALPHLCRVGAPTFLDVAGYSIQRKEFGPNHLYRLLLWAEDGIGGFSPETSAKVEALIVEAAARTMYVSDSRSPGPVLIRKDIWTHSAAFDCNQNAAFDLAEDKSLRLPNWLHYLQMASIQLCMRLNPTAWMGIDFESSKELEAIYAGQSLSGIPLRYRYSIRSVNPSPDGKVSLVSFSGEYKVLGELDCKFSKPYLKEWSDETAKLLREVGKIE
jgi:hypothetical protein